MLRQEVKPTKWQYAEYPGSILSGTEWTTCKHFPTEIHWELREAGRISDWNVGRAEHEVQWVSTRSWAFRSEIDLTGIQLAGRHVQMVFESLDTFVTVYLADNHFATHLVNVSPADLQTVNELTLVFHPPLPIGEAVAARYGPFSGGSVNLGNTVRMGIRKSQYHFRWDWGPELLCMGPDRDITVRIFESQLKEVITTAQVDASLKTKLEVEILVEGSPDVTGWNIILRGEDGKVVKRGEMRLGERVDWELDVDLWWPVGTGKPTRYTVHVDLVGRDGTILDSLTRKIGFRRVELVQTPLIGQEGTSFCFKVNNQLIWIGGSNWIPIDMILPSGTDERYRKWIELLVKGNQNMLRVWGGGVFEPDVFYDLCDEMGVLVWQDFMFACGVYPVFPKFLENVKKEAECNIKRLRHHPCLALLCGNNEDYQQILQWKISQSDDHPLPAIKIYEEILPEMVNRWTSPPIPYWFGSPYGGEGWNTADETVGDVHQWDVWAGPRYYHDWDIMGGRFVSEFGMPSLPDARTVDFWHGEDRAPRHPQSRMMQQHNKAGSYERRFALAMNENFRMNGDLESYGYLTQLLQSEAVGSAYVTWKRQWKGPGKEYNGGALVWQLNDCWPVTSWAIVDYFASRPNQPRPQCVRSADEQYRAKPAYYAIKRCMAPVSLGMRREVAKNRPHDRPRQFYEYGAFQSRDATIAIWAVNTQTKQTVNGELKIAAYDIATGWTERFPPQMVSLPPNRSTELWSGPCPAPPAEEAFDSTAPSGTVVILATLEPYKLLELPDPGLTVEAKGEGVIKLCVERPVKGVWLSVDGDDNGVDFDDNSLDLFPGDERVVVAKGISGKAVTAAWLGKEKASVVV